MKLNISSLASVATVALTTTYPVVVVQANGNFCGTSWVDAVSSCAVDCPSGAGCPSGQTCFANTPCVKLAPPPPPPPTPPPIPPPPAATTLNQNQNQNQQQIQTQPWGNNPGGSYTGTGGTCGDGNRGNGICPLPNECCSQYGHCGTSADHCASSQNNQNTPVAANNGGTCGEGNRGNGLCPIVGECCSQYGHCGTSAEHCAGDAAPPSTGGAAPSVYGTCGGGQTGNEICPNNNECCSSFGFCGTTAEHCSNKVGNFGPDYPAQGGQVQQPPQFQPTTTTQQSGNVGQPQFNQQGILVPGSSTVQQAPQPTAPQVYGTCGGGQTGNGICPINAECCSSFGFCGTTLEHCMNKVGPSFPGQPNSSQQQQQQQQQQVQQPNPQPTVPRPTEYNGQVNTQPQPTEYNGQVTTQQTNNNVPQYDSTQQQTPINNSQFPQPQRPYTPAAPHGTNKKIIGYYAGWQWYDRDKLAKPANLDFRKVQRVNYAFFQPDAMGNIYGTDRWGDPQLLFGPYSSLLGGGVQKCSYDGPNEVNCAYHEHNTGIINRAHAAGAEVYPSIGGWTLSDHFPTISADPVSRDRFAKKCIEILTHHDFDGIDIDWEYPGYEDHSGTPADKENFTKMLSAIRAALEMKTRETGKVYGLTAALPCNPTNIENIEVGKLTSILTEFNLMSYDLHGAWDEVTGMNAPLYYQGYGDEQFNIHTCVENYAALGVPRERINIGLPFYGRSFKFADSLNQQHGGNDVANWPEDDGTPQFFNIYNKLPHMVQKRDNKSKTQYAYINHAEQAPGGPNNPDGLAQSLPEGLVSFDDERAICDKVDYAQKNNCGGFIIWELSGDLLDDLTTPLLDITNRKLADPSLECCSLHSEEECEKERIERESASYSQMGGFDYNQWGPNSPSMSSSGMERPGFRILLSSSVLIAVSVVFS